MLDVAEVREKERIQEQASRPPSDEVSLIYDIGQAQKLHTELIETRPKLTEGVKAGEWFVKQEQQDANEHAIEQLDAYLGAANTQGGVLSDVQTEFDLLERDGVRLQGEMDAYAASKQGLGTEDAALEGGSGNLADVAQAQIKSTGRTERQLQTGFRNAVTSSTGSANTSSAENTSLQLKIDMQTASSSIVLAEHEKLKTQATMEAKADRLQSFILGTKIEGDEKKIAELKEKAAKIKEFVELLEKGVEKGIEFAAAPEIGAKDVAGAVKNGIFMIAEYAAAHAYDDEIGELENDVKNLKLEKGNVDFDAVVKEAKAAKEDYLKAAQAFINANQHLSEIQGTYRTTMQAMGASADKTTGKSDKYEVLAQLLAEADAFLARADATLGLAEIEKKKSEETVKEQNKLKNVQSGHEMGVPYYRADRWYTRGTLSWQANGPYYFHLREGDDKNTGHAEGDQYGVNPVMARAIESLTHNRDQIKSYAEALRKVFSARAH
jgi:hypothetical protein